ncbi:MAG: hypothetical protein FRX49_13116 [Trebouxia sp. A1-2]|nr:MAG: hypothetical protein FRX49_13116 [Trebouxia sp. A1-2]
MQELDQWLCGAEQYNKLERYLQARAAAGMPMGRFLFSAFTRSHNGFVDADSAAAAKGNGCTSIL